MQFTTALENLLTVVKLENKMYYTCKKFNLYNTGHIERSRLSYSLDTHTHRIFENTHLI